MPSPVSISDLTRFIGVADPQFSPEGDRILFSKITPKPKNAKVSNLFEVDLNGAVRPVTTGEVGVSTGRYTPDGNVLVFTSARVGDTIQFFVMPRDCGEARRITDLPEGSIGEYRISPDGKKIAYTFRAVAPERTKEALAKRSEEGLCDQPWEIDTVWYRLDGDGYFGGERYKLFVIDLPEGDEPDNFATPKLISSASPHGEYSFDWSPESDRLVVAHSARKEPFRETPNTQIWLVDLDGNAEQIPGLPTGDKESVRWSPKGDLIAYAGDVDEKDPWGTRNAKLYVVPVGGGEPRDLTAGTDYDLGVATLSDTKEAAFGAVMDWLPDGSAVMAQIGWFGDTFVAKIPLEGEVELIGPKDAFTGFGSLNADGTKAAVIAGDPTHLPEVGVLDLGTGEVKRLTGFNDDLDIEIRPSVPFETEAEDGHTVHGWAIFPGAPGEWADHPVIIEVHGGPHTQYGNVFFHEFQVLAAEGYVVVFSNPRGSKGYGEEHCAAIRGNWGDRDWADVQAVTEWVKSRTKAPIGIMGGSYGGYMTNWAIGHSDDYAAAITDRCVSNMVSMAGNSDFPSNKDGYFHGCAYGDLEDIRELWRQSPIAYFKNVKTPTLIIHSEGDLRCNVEQGEQVFSALQMEGVPSRFVRYPRSTSHGMSRGGPSDLRQHRLNEIVSWLDKYLKGATGR